MNPKILLKIMCIFALCMMATGQVTAVDLIGNVTNTTSGGITGAAVVIVGGGSASTVAGGTYNITGQDAGNYTVYARGPGTYRSIAEIELTTGFTSQNFSVAGSNYTIGDVDDITVDLMGTAAVELKDDIPGIVDIGVLIVIISLLTAVVSAIVGMVLLIRWKTQQNTRL